MRSKHTLIAISLGAALFVSGCTSPTGGLTTATVILLTTPTAVGSACVLPELASVPPTPVPPPSPTDSPPSTATAIALATPAATSAIIATRSGTAALTAVRATAAPQITINGTVAPTVAPTATVGPPPATPTATRVGVPARRQFLSTTIDGTPGVPALTPVAVSASPGPSAFSQGEVCAYVRTHPPHGNKLTTNAAPDYQVIAITLTTLDQFDQMFGTSGIAPAETLVYVVELAGQFTISGGPAPGFANSTTVTWKCSTPIRAGY